MSYHVRTADAWQARAVDIWIVEELPGARRLLIPDGATASYVNLDPEGPAPPPSLRLPTEALEALLAEAAELTPPTPATVEHLADARATRDRLLSLVERAHPRAR